MTNTPAPRSERAMQQPPRVAGYDRRRDLPRLIPLWPHEIADDTPQGRARLIARLRTALRAERRRGLAGDWTYDLARHRNLLRAYRVEVAAAGGGDVVPGEGRSTPASASGGTNGAHVPQKVWRTTSSGRGGRAKRLSAGTSSKGVARASTRAWKGA